MTKPYNNVKVGASGLGIPESTVLMRWDGDYSAKKQQRDSF